MPIVETPAEAIELFNQTALDVLVMENTVIEKNTRPYDEDILNDIIAFLESIDIEVKECTLNDTCLIPGFDIGPNYIMMDRDRIKYPGDLLHEAVDGVEFLAFLAFVVAGALQSGQFVDQPLAGLVIKALILGAKGAFCGNEFGGGEVGACGSSDGVQRLRNPMGAQLAAHLGLPYAFASHFAPGALEQAVEIYRRTFRPSPWLEKPYFMLAVNVFAAPTDEEGRYLRTTMQLGFARLRTGMPGQLPRPVDDLDAHISPEIRPMVDEALRISAVGSPDSVRAALNEFIARYEPDEVILTGQIHDHAARLRSFEIAADVLGALPAKA